MKREIGNALWLILHEWALGQPKRFSVEDRIQSEVFLSSWITLVEGMSGGCDCAKTVRDFVAANKAPSGRASCVQWAEDLHNVVNKKLGKPVYRVGVGRSAELSDCGCGAR